MKRERAKRAENKKELKKRWAKWCKCFDGNDINSINSQITQMVRDYAIWNLINSLRPYSKKASDGTTSENRILYYSIDKWFFETQMMAIRRLIDEYGIDDKNGVNSIMSVLNEIIKNAEYLTRENIFELRNLQYDYAPPIEEESKWLGEHDDYNGPSKGIPSELDYDPNDDLHKWIDILSKTSEEKREKSDTIDMNILTQLKTDLSEQCKKFKEIVNKYYAHAATEESRNTINADSPPVKEYKKAHELICKYADFIQVLLMDKSTSFLPLMPPDLFSHWDKPIFQGENSKLYEISNKIWEDYEAETKKWRQWDFPPFDEIKKRDEKKWLSLAEKTRRI